MLYVPVPQTLHEDSEDCPIWSPYLPVPQKVQDVVPLAYEPIGQVVAVYGHSSLALILL